MLLVFLLLPLYFLSCSGLRPRKHRPHCACANASVTAAVTDRRHVARGNRSRHDDYIFIPQREIIWLRIT